MHPGCHWFRLALARWGWSAALGPLLLALAACGTARAQPQTAPSPSATINTKGAGQTFGPTPLPQTPPPYAFAGSWTIASGLTQATAASPNGYAFAPSDGRVGYLCSAPVGQLFATSDGGAAWTQLHMSATTGCTDVFIDAHNASDLFVATSSVAQTNGFPASYDLWRSQNGGATWSRLTGVQKPTDPRLAWSQIAVMGSRLIAAVQVDEEGYLQNGLFASKDGGATWQPFAQAVANQGYTIGAFTIMGSAIYIDSAQGTNPGGLERRPGLDRASGAQPLAAPLSGQPNSSVYWRSLDGGATWSQVTAPGNTLTAAGNYALSTSSTIVATVDQQPIYDEQMWWSEDSGATWKRLPDLRGLEHGYVIAGSGSNGQLALAPDGSVLVAAQHDPSGYGDDAGVFRIQPGDTAAAWAPLVAGGVQDWQFSQTATDLRLWGIGAYESDTRLTYVDVAK